MFIVASVNVMNTVTTTRDTCFSDIFETLVSQEKPSKGPLLVLTHLLNHHTIPENKKMFENAKDRKLSHEDTNYLKCLVYFAITHVHNT